MHTKRTGGNHHVTTQDGFADLDVHLVGPHPILCHFLEKMAFHRIVSSCLGSSREMILDHSQTLAILVQNIILSPAPLYRIGAWAAPVCPRAIGLSETEKASLNDDRIARSLDALVSSQGRSLFFQLALHIINEFELDMKRIHQDTTSVKFFGNYSHSDVAPCITNGHSKDHRPDLKQLVFGLNVTADGAIPILHNIYSGNRTDDTVHCGNVDQLRKLLGKKDFIYVADSKLCTRKNMSHIASYKGKFITVLPRTRNEDKQFRSSLKEGYGVRWRRLLVMDNKRRENGPPDIYWTTSDGLNVTEEGYRLLWYRSSKKQKLDAQAREASLENTVQILKTLKPKALRRANNSAKISP